MVSDMKMRQLDGKKLFLTILGTFIMGAAVNMVFEPMNMVVGGLSGIAIVVKRLTEGFIKGGIPVWLTTAIINVPLFLAAWRVKGSEFIKNTLVATISFTVALYLIPVIPIGQKDNLLAALFGGVLSGAGLGLVFYYGGSTGGTDLLGAIINFYVPHVSVAKALLVIDSTIIIFGAFIFGVNKAMYAIIAAYVTTKIMNNILEGMAFAKMAYIISDHHNQISDEIFKTLNRGATFVRAQGGYTKQDKRMLMCVVSDKQTVQLKNLVAKIDPEAFLIITDAREVLGEGFIQYKQ